MRSLPTGFVILLLAPLVCIGQTPSPSPSVTPSPTPTPLVKVVDADAAGLIKLAISETNASFQVPLEIEGSDITNLSVRVDDFAALNGDRVRPVVKLDGKPAAGLFNISLNERPIVEITASFPTAGEYKSHLVVFYSGKHKNWNLVVERKKGDLTVQIEGLETAAATKQCTADALVRFTVRETSGQKVTLYPPTLEGLALKESDKVRKQARFKKIDLDGGPTATPAESYVVEPLSSRASAFNIRGIRDPGEYVATLRISGSNGNPVTKEVTVLVKSDWYFAVFWIFLGVLGSYLIRLYTKEERPKLEALRRLGHVEEDLAGVESEVETPAPAPVSDVFKGLAKQLVSIRRSLEEGTAVNNGAERFTEMEAKIRALPQWLTTGRRMNSVTPPELVRSQIIEWEGLGKTSFLTLAAPTEIGASLSKIEGKVGDALLERVKDFGKKVEDYKKAHPDRAPEIGSDIEPELDKAKENKEPDKWPLLTEHLNKARLLFAKVLARDFVAILDAAAPIGVDAAAWLTLKSELDAKQAAIAQETDPEKVESIYQEMNQTYFRTVISGLERTTRSLAQTPKDAAEPAKFEAATRALNSANGALVKGDWEAAKKEYQAAVGILNTVLAARAQAGAGAQNSSAAERAAQFGDMIPPGLTIGSVQSLTSVAERPSAESINNKIVLYDRLLDLVLLLVTCATGLYLLWANDPVWGGWKSSLTALLWGLGLHQVAGSTLSGLPAITKKLTEP